MKTVFFTILSDFFRKRADCYLKMRNSFKKYHPDIELRVFGQDMIDKVFEEKNIVFFVAKAVFGNILAPDYDLVVNIDSDQVFLGRCDKILKGDYDVAAPWGFNDYENASVGNVREDEYVQCGLVASTNKRFWQIWEENNKYAYGHPRFENDILSLIWYNDPEVKAMNKVILDKDKDYYGVKSLGREKEFYIENDKVMCRGEQVFIYHNAKGSQKLPKLQYRELGFPPEVVTFMEKVST